MIGSPENNFNTMQNQQPSPQQYGNALRNYSHPENRKEYMAYKQHRMQEPMYNMGRYNNGMSTAESYNKFGTPMPPMMMQPQSNASFVSQPPNSSSMFAPTTKLPQNNSLFGQSIFNTSILPQSNASSNLQPPLSAPQTSNYNTGLAAPNTQVQSNIVNGATSLPSNQVGSNGQVQSSIVNNPAKPQNIAITNAMLKGSGFF